MRTRSPFPGMDPWLEIHWGDVHHRLITQISDQIQNQLPEALFATIEVTFYISGDDRDERVILPDVSVVRPENQWSPASGHSQAGVAVAAPYRLRKSTEPRKVASVEIRRVGEESKLITAIEVLSPANKIGRVNRKTYCDKRETYYKANANVVEVDLLRTGADLVDVPFDELPDELITPYKAVVHRAFPKDGSDTEYYAIALREPLPRIAVPLRATDKDVVLDFQKAIDAAYEGGRYATRLKYHRPPVPALADEDREWATQLTVEQAR